MLVINNIAIKDDPIFKSISVTAHLHLPIKEVPEIYLGDYLKEMKGEGFSILGIEQSDKSVGLGDFVFPEKSVLVLGKEREGIPADLMCLLDCVIEIPQLGVIR